MSHEGIPKPSSIRADGGRLIPVIDCAGSHMGGARQYLAELDRWTQATGKKIRLIGRGRSLSLTWLAKRELVAARTQPRRTVALNNVSFTAAGRERTVILRNALHFLSPSERASFPQSPAWERQGKVVRALSRRSDTVIVPTSVMADRVLTRAPWLGDRLMVRPHPVWPIPPAADREGGHRMILCPILFAPYKPLAPALQLLVDGVERFNANRTQTRPARVVATLDVTEMRMLGLHPGPALAGVGRLGQAELDAYWARADAIFFPTDLESFGFPLAQARVNRQPVLAPRSDLAVEVAAEALVPYDQASPESVAAAVNGALTLVLPPLESNPFDPDEYFTCLFFR